MDQTPTFLVMDFETGGLDDRLNPALSAAVVIANNDMLPLDGMEQKFLPPKGTVIEVPIPEDQKTEIRKKRISHYTDVFTRTKYPTPPEGVLVINAVAAEINGYIKVTPTGWDATSIDLWHSQARSLADAEETFIKLIAPFKGVPPICVAHNASFDKCFTRRYLPKFFAMLDPNWRCTVEEFKAWYKARGLKGNAKLATLIEKCGYVHEKAHEAGDDAYACLAGMRWLVEERRSLGAE